MTEVEASVVACLGRMARRRAGIPLRVDAAITNDRGRVRLTVKTDKPVHTPDVIVYGSSLHECVTLVVAAWRKAITEMRASALRIQNNADALETETKLLLALVPK